MKNAVLVAFFCVCTSVSLAQQAPPHIRFERLTVADGLPENSVFCMIQDHLGFMWLGTQNGLVRYDGKKMTTFQYDPNNTFNLKARQVRALYEDKKGDVWIGGESLYKFERATQHFIEYPRKSPEKIKVGESIIQRIHEDSSGDIWIFSNRTNIGFVLDRFSPKTNTWTYFRNDSKNHNSLAGNAIYLGAIYDKKDFSFVEDSKGNIWTVTIKEKDKVLHWFDRKTSQFIRYKPKSIPTIVNNFNRIGCIALDNKDQLYLSSFEGGGLIHLNPKSGKIEQFKHDPKNTNSIRCDTIAKVYQDSRGLVWVTTNQGLDLLNPQTGVFTHLVSNPNDPSTPSAGILKFLQEMPNGDIWFVAKDGLNFYHRKTNQFIRYQNDPKNDNSLVLGNTTITSFLIDHTGLVWAGTWGGGLNKEKRLAQFPLLKAIPNNVRSLQSSKVYAVYEAPSEPSVIWFGTDKGLDRLDKKTGIYTHYHHDSLNHHSIEKGAVVSIVEDKKNRLWVSVAAKGFYLMDRKTGRFTRFSPHLTNPNALIFTYVNDLFAASDGTLWSSFGNGVAHIDMDKNEINYYYKKDSTYTPELFSFVNKLTIPQNRIAAILHPGNNADKTLPFTLNEPTELLIAAYGELTSTVKYDNAWIEDAKGKIVWEMSYEQSKSDGIYITRVQTQLLKLPAGTYQLRYNTNGFNSYGQWSAVNPYHSEWAGIQLLRISPKQKEVFKQLVKQKYQREGLADNTVICFSENTGNQILIGMNTGGLNIFDPKTGKFSQFYDHFNGPICILASLEDKKTGHTWLADYVVGLLLLDSHGKIIKRYNTGHGLPSNTVRDVQIDEKGFLWVSTNNGLSHFDPKIEQFRNFTLQNGLQDLEFSANGSFKTGDGELYFWGEKGVNAFYPSQLQEDKNPPKVVLTDLYVFSKPTAIGDKEPLTEHISIARKFTLTHDQNDFTIHFAALHYTRNSECQYAYRVINYDKDWIQAGTQQQARYIGLPSGTYTFQVKAMNADGVRNEKGASITIVVLPPWWRTWWAYTLYFLAFAGLLRAYILFRSRTLRRENKVLEEKVSLRTSQLEHSLENLKSTQNQLIQKEKLASLGELTAGIAHEIQNPLNFVNNFSELSVELVEELKVEREKVKEERDEELENELLNDLAQNQEKINHHGKRASSIVKGMLEHSRTGTGERQLTDINQLADEYLRLSYHGLRAKDSSFNSDYELISDENLPKINVVPQEIGRVLLNLINNAFYAVQEEGKRRTEQGMSAYKPMVTLSTKSEKDQIIIGVQDNGPGIPDAIKAKIFQPFFTTKPTGEGTGLGLSLSYDIITKGHGGTIEVESKEGEGSEFIITIPMKTNLA